MIRAPAGSTTRRPSTAATDRAVDHDRAAGDDAVGQHQIAAREHDHSATI
jgi:hypothetical protein